MDIQAMQKNEDSTPSGCGGIRLSFETNTVNPIILTDGYYY